MNARADLAALLDFFEVPTGNAFDVAPEKAIGFFSAKGLKPSFSYAETLDGEHDKAFTIAKMMNVDMLGQVHASLESAIANGVPFTQWRKEIIPILQSGGWWGKKEVKDPLTGEIVVAQLGSPARLETIFRTNAQSAYAAGHWQEIIAQQGVAPLLMYDAVDDFRTRPLHRSWDQKVLPVTNPWWSTHFPPNGWNSVVPDQRVSGHAMLGLKAWYSGPVVEVRGESGGGFTVTAQHPVLTMRGWVDAQSLREGDQLVAYRSEVGRGAVSADEHVDHAPPTIKEVFDSLGLRAGASVPRAALNLNGDAFFFEGDVEVVGADRVLVDRVASAAHEFAAKVDLLNAGHGQRLRFLLRSLVQIFGGESAANDGGRGIQGEAGKAIAAELPDLRGDRIRFDPIGSKVSSDVLSTLAKLSGDVAKTHPLFIEAENLLRHWFADLWSLHPAQPISNDPAGLRAGSLHPSLADDFVGGFGVNSDAASDILNRQAADVQIDRVQSLTVRNYSGHVYDLQTVSGTMILYGGESMPHYVVSNCRCGVIQLSKTEVDSLGLTPSIDPPKDGNYDWTNPRTGEVYTYPKGVDPGFANNPGQNYASQLKQLLKEKEQALPDALQVAAARADKKVQQLAADAVSGASQAQKSLASASAQAALERAQLLAAEKSTQFVAQQQIDIIAKGGASVGKGAAFKIKALQQLKIDENWPDLKPSVQLAKIESLATLLKAKQTLSSNLSLYKKAILDGKTPTPAAVKSFNSLSDADKAPFLEKIDKELAAIAAKKAAEAAKVAAGAETKIIGGNPPDPATLTKVGEQRGSNPGGTYLDTATGQKWYIKQPASADVARNEVLAGKLYELAGVEVPELHIVVLDGKVSIASKIVDGLVKADAATLAAAPGTAAGFAVDAWLANWDVVGLSFDNLLTLGSRAVRVDTGGALRYRAQGGLKGSVFGRNVTEIDSLRDPSLNRQAQQVFGRMTAAEIEDSVVRVLSVPDEQIRAIVAKFGPEDAATRAELADLLIARKRDLEARFPGAVARVRGNRPALVDAARVTEAEQQAVEASRVNGYSFATDSDQIEDNSVLVHAFKRKGGEATRGFFKLLPGASNSLLDEISKSVSTSRSPNVALADARNDMLAAIKSINFRAAKGSTLDVTVVSKVSAALDSSQAAIAQIEKAIAAADPTQIADLQKQLAVFTEWRTKLAPLLSDAQASKAATTVAGVFPSSSIPDALTYALKVDPSAASAAPKVPWKRTTGQYQFNTSSFDRSFATETSNTNGVHGTSLRYEATLPDGTRITYFPHDRQVDYAMQGIVKIDVPGRGLESTERVFGVIDEIGIKSTRAGEIDRQHLYLNAFARIRLLRGAELSARKLFDAVTDKGAAGVRAKLDILKTATGVDVEASEGWKTIDGVRQAFGHGRAHQLRPDLEGADFQQFDRDYVLFHNPDGLSMDAGYGAFEKIKPVIEGGGLFASLTDRVRRGVPLTGSSVSSDLASGGGDYHFTRVAKRGSAANGAGVYWRAKQVRRMDAISYSSDKFGKTKDGEVELSRQGQTVDSLKQMARSSGNETIFKSGLSLFDDVDRIVLATEAEVTSAIAWMQSKGYKAWPDGRQLAEVIITKAKNNAKP